MTQKSPEVPRPLDGWRTWNLDCLVEGSKTLQEFLDARIQLVNFLGMDMAGMAPDIKSYPLPDGRGGQGRTIYQPFVEPRWVHQALTTSFLIFDVWPEHFTVTLKSCLPFLAQAVCQEIGRVCGPVLDFHFWTLGPVAAVKRAWCGGGQ